MSPSLWQILVVVVLLVLLFGKGKISDLMGDAAKGIKSFKKGMADDDSAETRTTRNVEHDVHQEDGPIDVTPEARKDRA